MDYQSAINYLFNQLANYQKVGQSAYKPGLKNISVLLSKMGNPHHALKTVHLAGTNGKGSTAHILTSILIENGYKVGLFTSPHIKDFRERIKINGQLISKENVLMFVNQFKSVFDELQPSFFEITTAMAFYLFRQNNCDISIIETGLGGRLDSTNVINPEISIITNIGIDHTQFLGNTLKEIATEKAGIIKNNTPIVIGDFNKETFSVFESKSKKENAPLIVSTSFDTINTDLLGQFQQKNCSTALTAINVLKQKGWFFDEAKTKTALTRIKSNTNFKGRLEQISKNPKIIIDASHNIDGIKNLFKEIEQMNFNQLHCIYATSADKEVELIIKCFPKTAKFYLTTFNTKRSFPLNQLDDLAKRFNLTYSIYNNANTALKSAKQQYKQGDLIVVFGSFFLLEKII